MKRPFIDNQQVSAPIVRYIGEGVQVQRSQGPRWADKTYYNSVPYRKYLLVDDSPYGFMVRPVGLDYPTWRILV